MRLVRLGRKFKFVVFAYYLVLFISTIAVIADTGASIGVSKRASGRSYRPASGFADSETVAIYTALYLAPPLIFLGVGWVRRGD